MQIWTGKFCRLVLVLGVFLALGCSSSPEKPAEAGDIADEVSLKSDREALAELRKDIPEETRKANDRLAEMLQRWKYQKMTPEKLRERFQDEIRRMRVILESKHKKMRAEFSRSQNHNRQEFQSKQKEERDDFFDSKPKSDRRREFTEDQSRERERFRLDQRDARDQFEETIKDQRKSFDQEIAARWSEFRQEFPEYSRLHKEMKAEEAKAKEEARKNPQAYTSWPYKNPDNSAEPARPGATPVPETAVDVNKGGSGWPSSDPADFDKLGKSKTKTGP